MLAGAVGPTGAAAARPRRPAGVRISETPIPPPPPNPYAPDQAEPGSVEAIAALTTSLRFLPPAVAYLPASAELPSPARALGHLAGAAELSQSAEIHQALRRLAAASERVRVQSIGSSEEGREIVLALISDAANLADLDRCREVTARLADPRRVSRQEAERLADDGKVVLYLVGGTQASEPAGPEMLLELAYRLAVSERPDVRAIRENAVVLITPVADPDARDRAAEWYRRHVRARKLPWLELRELLAPPYGGHYVNGDAEADGMRLALAASRAIHETFFAFHPQLLVELAASPPLLELERAGSPPSAERAAGGGDGGETEAGDLWNQLSGAVAAALQGAGIPGVRPRAAGAMSGWGGWPGARAAIAANHNAWGGMLGVFGNGTAGVFEREVGVLEPAPGEGWPPGGRVAWSLRDTVNLQEAALLEALAFAARHRRELLRDIWERGARARERGSIEPPFAWLFPPRQPDPARLADLVRQLLAQRIEVHRLTADLSLAGRGYAAGSLVVRLDQPYRDAAIRFLEEQHPPPGGGRPAAYEGTAAAPSDSSWCWPLLYGVAAERIDERAVLGAAMEPVSAAPPPAGRVEGEGDVFVLRDSGQTALLRARIELGFRQVDAAEEPFVAAGGSYPPGSWIVQAPRPKVEEVASRLGLVFTAVPAIPAVRRHVIHLPRLALLHTWTDADQAGWARYELDREGVAYTLIGDGDLRRGRLAERFDLILMPEAAGDLKRLVHGIDPRWAPLAYTRTADFPSHGSPDGAADITGGMGETGLATLRAFVAGGGVLITLGNSSLVAVEGGLVQGLGTLPQTEYDTPGAELRARVLRPTHPIAYGYPRLTQLLRGSGPLFDVAAEDRGRVILQFGSRPAAAEETATLPQQLPEAAPAAATGEVRVEDLDLKGGHEPAPPPASPAARPSPPAASAEETAAGPAAGADAAAELGGAGGERGRARRAAGADARLVLSGAVRGEALVDGKAAIVDLPVGRGHVIVFAWNPFHRDLNRADLRFVYNVLLNWHALPD
ncbi:MAG TPA: M14 family zinc carboxypeptidase [Thermoanaerobaculia bacterium]|nr:M14 family zinc carboxypeptidase [Thermoanaerobaculia bacterium]